MQKGITPVVSIVLMLLITVILIAVAFLFFSKVLQAGTTAGGEQVGQITEQSNARFIIDTIDTNNDVIHLRNVGSVPLSDLTIYVNNEKQNTTYSTIDINSVGPVQLSSSLPEGTSKIKIATTGLFYVEQSVTVPARWVLDFPTDTSQPCTDTCLEVGI